MIITLLSLIGIGFLASGIMDSSNSNEENASHDSHEDQPEMDVHSGQYFEDSESLDSADASLSTLLRDQSLFIDEIEFDAEFMEGRNILLGEEGGELLDGASNALADSSDHLFGGDGSDILIGGDSDVLIGGEGTDRFEIGVAEAITILDFEADEILVVRYEGDPPAISLASTDDGTSILANGLPVAYLIGVYNLNQECVVLFPSNE